MSMSQDMLTAVETAIMNLLSGAEEIRINGRKYRKSNLPQLQAQRQILYEEVFFENLSIGGPVTTRAYAAWPLRKGGMPPWGSIGPWSR